MTIWLVTMVAVYDHGCAGVFSTERAAVAHAAALDAESDGHHTWRVDELRLDEPLTAEPLGLSTHRPRSAPPVWSADRVEIVRHP